MKPITFENLRRLVGGGRKKKEKESFKRSDSFKRISIRKSYLDRGKKKHLQKLEVATQTVAEEVCKISVVPSSKVDSSVQVDKHDISESDDVCTNAVTKSEEHDCCGGGGPGQSVIAYGQWLKGIRKEDVSSSGFKGAERTVIYIPASDEDKQPSPVIRQLSSSPVFRKKSPYLRRKVASTSPHLQRKESNDSAVEMFPWGDSSDIKKSPLIIKRRTKQSPVPLLPGSGSEEMCSLSISLGRIWMDAPQGLTPRSLEMPKSGMVSPPAHHSLDSALKDLRDDHIVINRLQKRPTAAVSRTLSSTSNTTASTGLFSSKDSGFSFSISAPKLSSFTSGISVSKKKKPKPKLSVSRDGYFKRTSGVLVETRRSSIKRKSSRKKKNRSSGRHKRNKNNLGRNELYQVVVSRPSKSLRSLKLDPMIFVPPEKRRVAIKRKQSFKLSMREIRNFNPLNENVYSSKSVNGSADEGLYESLPGECDYCSDEQPLSGRISRISLREDDYDFPSNDFASATTPVSEKSVASVAVSDSDSDGYSLSSRSESPHNFPGVSPVPKRRPVRRRKSGLSTKRSITYVAKPTVVRAPSTLRKMVKKSGKHTNLFLFIVQFISTLKIILLCYFN